MDSLKMVTKYETVSEGVLEWEIQNVSLHFKKCGPCWDGADASLCKCGYTLNMNSGNMQLPVGDGRQSWWQFVLNKNQITTGAHHQAFSWNLFCQGVFGSDVSRIKETLNFQYNATVCIETSIGDIVETLQTLEAKECTDPTMWSKTVYFPPIQIYQLKSVWPNGNIKITVRISHLSQRKNELFNKANANGVFLDSLDLKDDPPEPLGSCYGNLMNNPDLSDFTIICQGSSFHAHKFILSVRSPVFRTMIESGLSETTQNELTIEDMTTETVELMLEFIYKGTVQIFPADLKEKIQLLDCAEKYELNGLKSICMRKIFSNLPTEQDVGELAMAAFTYGANDRVKKVIRDFCTMNFAKLIQNLEYKKLFLANPQAFIN